MLRLAIGTLGVVLIGLGFSSDKTLTSIQSALLGGSDEPQATAAIPSVAEPASDVATIQLVGDVSPADGAGLSSSETIVAMSENSKPTNPAVDERIEIVPAVSLSGEQAVVTPANSNATAQAGAIKAKLQQTTAMADTDTLYVLRKTVNMRKGPSIEHAILLQLEQGQELMEFKRDGKWVQVGAYGTSGTVGWVHGSLVGAQL